MGLFDRLNKKAPASSQGPAPPFKESPSAPFHPPFPDTPIPLYQSPYPPQHAGVVLPPPPPRWVPPCNQVAGYAPQQPYFPIVVNQHYISSPSQIPARPAHQMLGNAISKLNLGSVVDLASDVLPGRFPCLLNDGLPALHHCGSHLLDQGNVLYDQVSYRFDSVMTLIDLDRFNSNEEEPFSYQGPQPPVQMPSEVLSPTKSSTKRPRRTIPQGINGTKEQSFSIDSSNSTDYIAKFELYANSKLPLTLPPLKLYIPTYPLLCLASEYSERVYEKPRGAERHTHVEADWWTGTKAMIIKSVPMDNMDTIVFAIRGTANFMDWAVNLSMTPKSPEGFLDDPGNLCHEGFLSVARKMIKPVAQRLRQLLKEDPARKSYSFLLTGHSAGGAVAALLYSHMLATSKAASSELNALTGCFRRIHCITFGTPPVSLLPLTNPAGRSGIDKFLFLTFVNEGDPVARADKDYVRSLLDLYTTPSPSTRAHDTKGQRRPELPARPSTVGKKASKDRMKHDKQAESPIKSIAKSHKSPTINSGNLAKPAGPIWKVPPAILSSAGRIVVLRSGNPQARRAQKKTTLDEWLAEGVVAQVATDQLLRNVIWGDPVCHVMRLYAARIEVLAYAAVTGKAS